MTEGLDLHLGVDKAAGFVGRALEAALREAIRSGRLHPWARLPGSRSLAADLGISRGTVVQAYTQLIAEGWLTGTTGSGTRVADLPGAGFVAGPGEDLSPAAARLAVDLRPGRPDLSSFPRTVWATSVRRALSAAPYEDLDYAEPAGLPVLRAAVADYVTRARGVRADAAAVVITAGFTPGLAWLARVLRGLGTRTVATEDPGLGRHRDVLHAAGLATAPLEVGPAGADPGGLAPGRLAPGSLAGRAPVRAVVLTPAHQYPRGVVLGARHRSAFVDWARREDGFIVEDDYDGEFRYDVRGLPALHSMTGGPDVVAYLGTASKILAPGLRVAWLIVPPGLRQPVRDALARTDERISAPAGDALAHFIASGHLASHLARAARTYAARRRALIAGLRGTGLRITGVDAGLHLVADLPAGTDEVQVQRRLAEAGLAVDVLGQFSTAPLERRALVCGYALLPETQAAAAAAAIAGCAS